jgi:hypothetical protein
MIGLALQKLHPGVSWRLADEPKTADEYEKFLEWNSETQPPTWDEVETAHQQVLAELELRQIKRNRSVAYTAESDPLFFKAQAGEVDEAEWLAKREEIRARFPYPTEVTP